MASLSTQKSRPQQAIPVAYGHNSELARPQTAPSGVLTVDTRRDSESDDANDSNILMLDKLRTMLANDESGSYDGSLLSPSSARETMSSAGRNPRLETPTDTLMSHTMSAPGRDSQHHSANQPQGDDVELRTPRPPTSLQPQQPDAELHRRTQVRTGGGWNPRSGKRQLQELPKKPSVSRTTSTARAVAQLAMHASQLARPGAMPSVYDSLLSRVPATSAVPFKDESLASTTIGPVDSNSWATRQFCGRPVKLPSTCSEVRSKVERQDPLSLSRDPFSDGEVRSVHAPSNMHLPPSRRTINMALEREQSVRSVRKLQQNVHTLEEQNGIVSRHAQEVEAAHRHCNPTIRRLQHQLGVLTTGYQRLEGVVQEQKDKLKQEADRNALIEASLEHAQRAAAEHGQEARLQIQQLQKHCGELETALQEANEQIQEESSRARDAIQSRDRAIRQANTLSVEKIKVDEALNNARIQAAAHSKASNSAEKALDGSRKALKRAMLDSHGNQKDYEAQINVLNHRISVLRQQMKRKDMRLAKLADDCDEATARATQLDLEMKQTVAKYGSAFEDKETMSVQLAETKDSLEKLQKEHSSCAITAAAAALANNRRVTSLKSSIDKLTDELDTALRQRDKEDQAKNALRETLETVRQVHENRFSSLQAELDAANIAETKLRAEVLVLSQDFATTKAIADDRERDLAQKSMELSSLKREYSQALQLKDELEGQVSHLRVKLERVTVEHMSCQGVRIEAQKFKSVVSRMQLELKSLKSAHAGCDIRLDSLRHEHLALLAEHEKCSSASQVIAQLQSQISGFQHDKKLHAQRAEKINELQSRIRELLSSSHDEQERLEACKVQVATLQAQLNAGSGIGVRSRKGSPASSRRNSLFQAQLSRPSSASGSGRRRRSLSTGVHPSRMSAVDAAAAASEAALKAMQQRKGEDQSDSHDNDVAPPTPHLRKSRRTVSFHNIKLANHGNASRRLSGNEEDGDAESGITILHQNEDGQVLVDAQELMELRELAVEAEQFQDQVEELRAGKQVQSLIKSLRTANKKAVRSEVARRAEKAEAAREQSLATKARIQLEARLKEATHDSEQARREQAQARAELDKQLFEAESKVVQMQVQLSHNQEALRDAERSISHMQADAAKREQMVRACQAAWKSMRSWSGLRISMKDIADENKIGGESSPRGQVVVTSVAPDGPGQRAGIRVGDVILSVDSTEEPDVASIREALRRTHPGESVSLLVERDGQHLLRTVVSGAVGFTPSRIHSIRAMALLSAEIDYRVRLERDNSLAAKQEEWAANAAASDS